MNIHITANYKITNTMYNPNKCKTEDYEEISQICSDSFKKNLKNLDKSIILVGEKPSYHELFKEIFYKQMDMYKWNDCNILWTDADTICIKPTEIFDKFENFNMFWDDSIYCNFPAVVPRNLYKGLIPWMMSNIRYFPKGLPNSMWELGEPLAKKWINVWAYECIIYNTMFHSQKSIKDEHGVVKNKYLLPEYNFQMIRSKKYPNMEMKDANIVHFHSSRGSKDTIRKMKKISSI